VPRKKSPTLTEAELRLMNVLWEKGTASVGDVVEALPRGADLAYNSVLTTMRILEQKGYIRHKKSGRAFVYYPVVARNQASESEIRYLARRFFNDSRELLVLNLLKDETLDEEELKRIRQMLDERI